MACVVKGGPMAKEISATQFQARCLQLLDEVQRSGQELVIFKRGCAVARVVPELQPKPWLALKGKGSFKSDPFAPVLDNMEIEALR